MKKIVMLCAAAAVAFAITGCSSIQTANQFNGQDVTLKGKPIAHISAVTTGLYLFSIPLISGSVENPGMPTVITDTVNSSALAGWVAREAANNQKAGGIVDLVTQDSSTGFILYWRSSTASATAVK